ncbi:hypothetical protein [Lysinibacter cavernae]|uniref:Uncharacterized protein n=1 Tax=Lysinibacter cavernae TaxID=1640652 RepID=A0A7X5QYC2_9MICO|nr:hypothetical protein [Lysinibacter cavernae]NIH52159.1 hypothetical protein [Lysinibacter cavernae]
MSGTDEPISVPVPDAVIEGLDDDPIQADPEFGRDDQLRDEEFDEVVGVAAPDDERMD